MPTDSIVYTLTGQPLPAPQRLTELLSMFVERITVAHAITGDRHVISNMRERDPATTWSLSSVPETKCCGSEVA